MTTLANAIVNNKLVYPTNAQYIAGGDNQYYNKYYLPILLSREILTTPVTVASGNSTNIYYEFV